MPDPRRRPQLPPLHASRSCVSCGRTITWRKKWERDWDSVNFCSDSCRAKKLSARDRQLEDTILNLLSQRGRDKSICPSEAARAVASAIAHPGTSPEAWEPLMEPARAAARRLAATGQILITQGGHTVDPSTAKGPIRLRLR